MDEILSSTEISSLQASNDGDLIKGLQEKGFKPISFPGCGTDIKKYIDWHKGVKNVNHHSACEGYGMVFRLFEFPTQILKELNDFLTGNAFNKVVAEKFDVEYDDCITDGGIQKYLDGYEISPHADQRKKAVTFMVNINPSEDSEKLNYHTHYLKLKKPYSYIEEFWSGNESIDRSWIPWGWAETMKEQRKNNSIVMFSPSNDTLHGVKAEYNHLKTQRTQLYGNIFYKQDPSSTKLEWEDLEITSQDKKVKRTKSFKVRVAEALPMTVKTILARIMEKSSTGRRNRY